MSTINIPPQTPLFRAIQKERYSRRQFIQEIQNQTGRKLIVYIANLQHPGGGINQTDILAFGDLLEGVAGIDVDLILQSSGGDIDVAEKIVYMCRGRAKGFRVIVPESAKSAATLIALAADEIVMSDTSELGPIDPQITINTPDGNTISRPAQSFLDGLQAIQDEVKNTEGTLSPVYFPLLQQLDPALIDFCRKAIKRAERFAEKWLKRYQCKSAPRTAKQIAKKLLDPKRYLLHGTVIDYNEATTLKLCVKYLPPHDPLWEMIWRLYCTYEIDMRKEKLAKILESESVSLPLI
jgi:ATP-dependent protease ClpP protease subunit